MKLHLQVILCLILFSAGTAFSQGNLYSLSSDSLVNLHAGNKKVYRTIRTVSKPRIDGKLDDACWLSEGYWEGNFIQQQPVQGRQPSQDTWFKILYDEDNLYVALKCYDSEPQKISDILGRRDDFTSGDIAGIALDTYFDKTTAFEFNVSAAGQKIDLVHLGAYLGDTNWDAVWEGKAHVADSMWCAEFRIPFSQLRFSDQEDQVWGMHIWRFIDRLDEEDHWKLIPVDAPAMVYIFGELQGISGIRKKKHIELMPFAAGRHVRGGLKNEQLGYGIDGKIGLTSNFTLDFTVLPDFGQVEADPSELNLTSYEVFYEEKRPFFLEGNSILDYSVGTDLLFYSRRIGQAPSYTPSLSAYDQVQVPSGTTILNALKLTGKNRKGLSLGVMNSLTSKEFAEVATGEITESILAEPLTNYFVGRVKQDLNNGNTIFGGMITSVTRSINDDHLQFLPESSLVGGVDMIHNWLNRKYFIDLKSFYSRISGSNTSIALLQRSPRHLYQRADASHLEFNPGLTLLEGWGGQLSGGKQSGKFRATGSLSWRSPGVDTNDLGYLREADLVIQRVNLRYQVNQPRGIIRNYYVTLDERADWTFGGEKTHAVLNIHGYMKFKNLWSIHLDGVRSFGKIDTRLLRGGPSLRLDPYYIAEYFLQSNSAKRFFAGFGTDRKWVDQGRGGSTEHTLKMYWKISNRLMVSSESKYEDLTDINQYVTQNRSATENRYIVGQLERETFYTTLRAEVFATPELSFQFYGSPYFSRGKFTSLKKVGSSLDKDIQTRLLPLQVTDKVQYMWFVDETGNNSVDFMMEQPDFNFHELRSNFVLRWEYRAGSTLYLVWTHNRYALQPEYPSNRWNLYRDLAKAGAENAFMLKISYWLSL